jgi:lipoate-protein ligase B
MGVTWLGRAAYREVLALQLATRERVWAGHAGEVLLCEHPPTITLGRSAKRENILASDEELVRAGVAVEQIERGGDVTYHGPGQLMIYPIVKLRGGVVDFLERVASAISDACSEVGVRGAVWQRDPAGVWIGDAKIAACGIHVARGVSVHGFALDVATPSDAWARIRPCGLAAPQTSIAIQRAQRGAPIDAETLAGIVGPLVVTALAR